MVLIRRDRQKWVIRWIVDDGSRAAVSRFLSRFVCCVVTVHQMYGQSILLHWNPYGTYPAFLNLIVTSINLLISHSTSPDSCLLLLLRLFIQRHSQSELENYCGYGMSFCSALTPERGGVLTNTIPTL